MDESEMRMDQRVRKSLQERLREAFITGLAVIVPMLVTVIVLAIAFRYIANYLTILAQGIINAGDFINIPVYGDIPVDIVVIQVLTPVVLLVFIMVVGIFTNSTHWGERAVDYFDYFISQIPAVGGVYESFRQMSDVMLESDTQSFRDVKLVEFPHEGAYTLGFVTTETPSTLSEAAGHAKMLTLFLPLAPNPVMGGHLVHMPAEKVMDVDMTVEEGIRAIVTSGVAVADGEAGEGAGLSEAQLRDLASVEHADQQLNPEMDSPGVRRSESVNTDRSNEYDEAVEPSRATTPDDIARRERTDSAGSSREESSPEQTESAEPDGTDDKATPAEKAGRYESESGVTAQRPAAAAGRDAEDSATTETRPAEAASRDAEHRDATQQRPAEAADRDSADRANTEERPEEVADRTSGDGDETEDQSSEDPSNDEASR